MGLVQTPSMPTSVRKLSLTHCIGVNLFDASPSREPWAERSLHFHGHSHAVPHARAPSLNRQPHGDAT
jgi:hypothetical protein